MDSNMKQILEGQLSKYTNVMKGWQYRWFVLNPEAGTLSYYMIDEQKTSSRARGCVHLAGAVVSPSDEDSNTFSVNAAGGELYRLRATDARQRQQWVDRLRTVTELFNRVQAETGSAPAVPRAGDKSSEVAGSPRPYEAPLSVLSSLHDASAALQQTAAAHHALADVVRQLPAHASEEASPTSTDAELLLLLATSQATLLCLEQCYSVLQQQRSAAALPIGAPLGTVDGSVRLTSTRTRPEKDFLADVADWFDTTFNPSKTQRKPSFTSHAALRPAPPPPPSAGSGGALPAQATDSDAEKTPALHTAWPSSEGEDDDPVEPAAVDLAVGADDSAALRALLTTLKLGTELTRQRLPTSLLSGHSLLEDLSNIAARPHAFIRIGAGGCPEERLLRVLEWYLPAVCATCPRVARKPFNPRPGEVFLCSWLQSGDRAATVRFLAEQVSHHPPVSALCVSAPGSGVSLQATLGSRAQYVTSATVSLIGEARVHVAPLSETYAFNYPTLYVRSLLSDRWVEMGGQVKFTCQQTGCSATLTFHTKPATSDSGERHRVTGEVRSAAADPAAGPGLVTHRLDGNWQSMVHVTPTQPGAAAHDIRCDVAADSADPAGVGARRRVRPISAQLAHESRRYWWPVASALRAGDVSAAEEQRAALHAAQQRRRSGSGQGGARHFYQHDSGGWVCRHVLT